MLSEEEELRHLKTMLATARELSRTTDPFLQGYFAHLVGRLSTLLTVWDPESAWQDIGDLD